MASHYFMNRQILFIHSFSLARMPARMRFGNCIRIMCEGAMIHFIFQRIFTDNFLNTISNEETRKLLSECKSFHAFTTAFEWIVYSGIFFFISSSEFCWLCGNWNILLNKLKNIGKSFPFSFIKLSNSVLCQLNKLRNVHKSLISVFCKSEILVKFP